MTKKTCALVEWESRAKNCLRSYSSNNQSRELEHLKNVRALLLEFESMDFVTENIETTEILNLLASAARDPKRHETYAKMFFEAASKSFASASEGMAKLLFSQGDMEGCIRYLDRVAHSQLSRAGKNKHFVAKSAIKIMNASAIAAPLIKADPQVLLNPADMKVMLNHLRDEQQDGARTLLAFLGITDGECFDPVIYDEKLANPSVDMVFCGGFKWSGTSAVRDYLIDFHRVYSPPENVRLFVDADFNLRRLRNRFCVGEPKGLLEAARGLVLEKIIGLTLHKLTPQRAQKKQNAAIATHHNDNDVGPFGVSGIQFFDMLFQARDKFPRVALQHWISDCTRAVCPSDIEVAVYDSVLRAPDREMLTLLWRARMLVVFRDPRDMYVTHVVRGGWSKGVDSYIESLQKMLNDYEQSTDDWTTKVQFERFILSKSYREKIGRIVLKEDSICCKKPKFNPHDSITNIGIHNEFEDQAALMQLKDAFPNLCIDNPMERWQDT